MTQLITAIGILLLVIGVVFFVRPQLIRSFIEFAKIGKRIYFGGAIRVLLGGLLLAATPNALFPWIPGSIGALMLISGVLIFVLGITRTHAIMDWWYVKTDNQLRIAPVIAAVLGILLIYSA